MKSRVSSTVTKRKPNPRPRKYASASERQAAYRDRAPEVCFRAEPKTVETLDRIADTIDRSRAELLLSMTKFALTNHDWERFGLTHKTLPKYEGNPIMATARKTARKTATKRKPTPAQLAARERFAEMARAGSFKKAGGRKSNPETSSAKRIAMQLDRIAMGEAFYGEALRAAMEMPFLTAADRAVLTRYATGAQKGSDHFRLQDIAIQIRESEGRKTNPARKAAGVRSNPARKAAMAPSTVYQVQNSKDGKAWEVWGTYMYLPMAKDVANRRAAEAPREYVRVESIKVKA